MEGGGYISGARVEGSVTASKTLGFEVFGSRWVGGERGGMFVSEIGLVL